MQTREPYLADTVTEDKTFLTEQNNTTMRNSLFILFSVVHF